MCTKKKQILMYLINFQSNKKRKVGFQLKLGFNKIINYFE